jgi:hypothetical protein
MTESQPTTGVKRSTALTVAGAVLFLLAIPYAGVAGLFSFIASNPQLVTIKFGGFILPFGLGRYGMLLFLALALLTTFAGLAAIRRWRAWRIWVRIVAWLTLALSLYCAWIWFVGSLAGVSLLIPIGLLAIAGFVLWAETREQNPV